MFFFLLFLSVWGKEIGEPWVNHRPSTSTWQLISQVLIYAKYPFLPALTHCFVKALLINSWWIQNMFLFIYNEFSYLNRWYLLLIKLRRLFFSLWCFIHIYILRYITWYNCLIFQEGIIVFKFLVPLAKLNTCIHKLSCW